MSSVKVFVLDVGHGNAAVVASEDRVQVIDAGPGSSLIEFLISMGIVDIDDILISHADEDHIAGLVGLLSTGSFRIRRVRLNTDAEQRSKIWKDLAVALDDASRAGDLDFSPSLTQADNGKFDLGDVRIEILGPSGFLAMRGPGSLDRQGRRISTNSISAVIRVTVRGERAVLFAGDVDEVGLEEIARNPGTDLTARVLVFPHHGGSPGGSADRAAALASRLCDLVKPECVIFSIGRGRYGNPTPAVVHAIRELDDSIRVACTQLSENCAARAPLSVPTHLRTEIARGRDRNHCCAGTLVIEISDSLRIEPGATTHLAFINSAAPHALCK